MEVAGRKQLSSLLPHGGGGFTQQGGVGCDERYWDAGQEYRLVRKMASPTKGQVGGDGSGRKKETVSMGTRSKVIGSSESSSSRGVSEHMFGDKGIVDTWRNWNLRKGKDEHFKVEKRSRDRSDSRGRNKSRSSTLNQHSGRRERRRSRSRSSTLNEHSGRRER